MQEMGRGDEKNGPGDEVVLAGAPGELNPRVQGRVGWVGCSGSPKTMGGM